MENNTIKTDCFAYRKVKKGSPVCNALGVMICRNEANCPFYRTAKEVCSNCGTLICANCLAMNVAERK